MPSGLCNASGTFQRTVNVIFFCLEWQLDLFYIDDIVISSQTLEQHTEHVQKVLRFLNSAGATFNLKKCSYFTSTINSSKTNHMSRTTRIWISHYSRKTRTQINNQRH